jgi:hypothetical protein
MAEKERKEPADEKIKRYEALYSLAQHAHAAEASRFEEFDEKASRLLTVLVIVLGAAAFGIGEFLGLLSDSDLPIVSRWFFLTSSSLFFLDLRRPVSFQQP